MLFTSARRRIYAPRTNASCRGARVYIESGCCASRFPCARYGAPSRRRRAIEMQTSGISRSSFRLLPRSASSSSTSFSTSKAVTIRVPLSSNVRLTAMRDRRVSGYSLKNYSYSLRAFKRVLSGICLPMLPRDKRISRSLYEWNFDPLIFG